MPTGGKSTLTQFLIEERRRHPESTGELNALVTAISVACKAISRRVAYGRLGGLQWESISGPSPPEEPKPINVILNDVFVNATEWGGHVAGMVSKEQAEPYAIPNAYPLGKYLLLFDPLDGASNIDLNVAVGSIFSVLRAPRPGARPSTEDFLQPGLKQVCAGYAIYGPSTILVLTLGAGTHAFTLEPLLGEWILSHSFLKIPAQTREFAINASNARFWEPAVKRYVDECLAGTSGPLNEDFNMRWIASLVAETHRILMRGGVFLYTRETRAHNQAGHLRLLYEVNPISFLVEQAQGVASTGRTRTLDVQPESLHERVGFVFGSSEEVGRIESYHREEYSSTYRSPLFGDRGLFAALE